MADLNKLQQRKNNLLQQLKKLEEQEKKTTIKLIMQSLKSEKDMDTEFILAWIKATENIRKTQWQKWQNSHDEKELKNDINYLYNKLINKPN